MKIIEKIRSKITANGILKYVSYTMSTSLVNQLRSFIFVFIATKSLSVDEYGVYTLILMVIMTASELSDMGMNSAITRFSSQYYAHKEIKKEYDLICYAFRRKFFSSIFIMVILMIFSQPISKILLGENSYQNLIIFSAIGILFALLVV